MSSEGEPDGPYERSWEPPTDFGTYQGLGYIIPKKDMYG